MRKKRKKSDALDPFLGGMLNDPNSVVRSSEFIQSQGDPNSVVRQGEMDFSEREAMEGRQRQALRGLGDPNSAVRPSEIDPSSAVRPGEMNGGGGLFGMPPSVINEAMQKTSSPGHELVELKPEEIKMVNKVFRNNSSTTFDTKNPVTGVGVGQPDVQGSWGQQAADAVTSAFRQDQTEAGKAAEHARVRAMGGPGASVHGNEGRRLPEEGGGAPGTSAPAGVQTRQNVSTSGSSLDQPVTDFRNKVLGMGTEQLDQEWTPYGGKRFEDKSADTTTAMNLVRGGVGAETGAFGTAGTAVAGEQDFRARDVTAGTAAPGMGAYERDWESKVIDPARKQAEFELSRQLGSIGAKEAGIAGGGRHSGAALERGAARGMSSMGLANLTGQLSREGYKTALGASQSDRDAALRGDLANQGTDVSGAQVRIGAGRAGADIAGQTQDSRYRDINALSGVGAAEEAYGQRDKDWAYDQHIEERDWDKNQAEWGANLMASAPSGQTGYQSSPQYKKKDRWGRAMAGAAAGSTFGPWGAAGGAALGYFS